MLALVLALLAAVAGLPSGGPGGMESAAPEGVRSEVVESAVVVVPAVPCCEAEAGGAPAAPCGPGDSCPPFGGCCACVSCVKRAAEAPPSVAPAARVGESVERAPAGAPGGIDGGGAVWHPPRG